MMLLSLLLMFGAAFHSCTAKAVNSMSKSRFSVADRWIVDQHGRVRIFHGFNSVLKGFPYYDDQIVNVTRLELYRQWGFNAVRLGTMWAGAQPVKQGQFNETYISTLEHAVKQLSVYGIYVLLDMHQDVMSSAFGSYDGVPRWLIDRLPPAKHKYPWPFRVKIPEELWAFGYLTEAVSVAFQQLYDNVSGARDAMVEFWTKIASVFADHGNILGYEVLKRTVPLPCGRRLRMKKDEARPFSAVTLIIGRKDITRGSVLDQVEEEEGPARNWLTTQFHLEKRLINFINEPWAGDVYRKPSLLMPGEAGRDNLAPLYDHLNMAVRSVDEHTLIFYEPVTWSVFLSGREAGTGFSSVPGGPEYKNRSVLSYHYYCWLIDQQTVYEHYKLWQRVACDDVMGPLVMPSVHEEVMRLGGSSFLTEFGLCAPNGDEQSIDTVECEFVMREADEYLQSWTYWDSEFFNDSLHGEVDWNVVRAFARVYARAVSGIPTVMDFDPRQRQFRLEWQLSVTIRQPTEVFVPEVHYPHGFNVYVSEGLGWTFDSDLSVLYVRNEAFHSTVNVYLSILPKL